MSNNTGISRHAPVLGYIDYNDTSTSETPVSMSNGVWTSVPNNGLGPQTSFKYAPNGVTSLMDTSTGRFDFSQLQLGDVVLIRNTFTVTPDLNNRILKERILLGSSPQFEIGQTVGRLDEGAEVAHNFSANPLMIYMGSEDVLNSPGIFQVQMNGSGSLVVSGTVIEVLRG